MLKIVKCAWENSDVSSSVQDFHRLYFKIVTSVAASTPKEVRASPQRGSGPVSQKHLERGLRLDLFIGACYHGYSDFREITIRVRDPHGFRNNHSNIAGWDRVSVAISEYNQPDVWRRWTSSTMLPYTAFIPLALVEIAVLVVSVHSTVYPKKYAHGFVVPCFVVVMQSFIMNSHDVFIHIHQGCFAGTVAIVRLPQCQWSKPDGYGKTSQCITTTKHNKAKTVCIFLGIYCTFFPAKSLNCHISQTRHTRIPLFAYLARICASLIRPRPRGEEGNCSYLLPLGHRDNCPWTGARARERSERINNPANWRSKENIEH